MFDGQTPNQNPLNPVMPSPGMTPPMPGTPAAAPAPAPKAEVHTMPERFRSAGGSGGPKPSSSNKKLMIILIVLLVVAALGAGGYFVFTKVLQKTNTNTVNTNTGDDNENFNDNENANDNVNVSNGNDNTNVASNENSNGNSNSNSNSNANSNSNSNTNTAVTNPDPLPSTTDADQDGLTDNEESVYGTDVAKTDSDGDTFIDGRLVQADGTVVGEVAGGYNPKGAGRLEGSTLATRQQNASAEYSILVPATWSVVNDASGGMLVNPALATGEFFRVQINDNPSKLTPQQWYQSIATGQSATMTSIAVNGLEGLLSQDHATVYLFKDAKVYAITYNTGSLSQVNYHTTFGMLYQSFKLGGV